MRKLSRFAIPDDIPAFLSIGPTESPWPARGKRCPVPFKQLCSELNQVDSSAARRECHEMPLSVKQQAEPRVGADVTAEQLDVRWGDAGNTGIERCW
jgi:hypothetical protein